MRTIGIRELRQSASRYVRLVARGETVQITDRGVPVALLTPIGSGSPLEMLIDSGRASRAEGDVLELGPPIRPRTGAKPASEMLRAAREGER